MKLGPCRIEMERSDKGTKLVIEGWAAIIALVFAAVLFSSWLFGDKISTGIPGLGSVTDQTSANSQKEERPLPLSNSPR